MPSFRETFLFRSELFEPFHEKVIIGRRASEILCSPTRQRNSGKKRLSNWAVLCVELMRPKRGKWLQREWPAPAFEPRERPDETRQQNTIRGRGPRDAQLDVDVNNANQIVDTVAAAGSTYLSEEDQETLMMQKIATYSLCMITWSGTTRYIIGGSLDRERTWC